MSMNVIKLGILNNPSFKFTISTDNNGDTFTLPLVSSGAGGIATHNFTISWGDGSMSTITSWDDADKTHTYITAGTYTVAMKGTCTHFIFDPVINASDALKVNRVWNIYDMGFKEICFNGCANLTQITSNFKKLKHLVTAEDMFNDCIALTYIPAGIFDGSPNITSFRWTFRGCTALAGSIPSDLFKYNTLVTTFDGTFGISYWRPNNYPPQIAGRCENLTGSIPPDLFTYNPLVTDFDETFSGCSGLTGAIPSTLFSSNPLVTTFENTFGSVDYYTPGCSGLTSIPSTLFTNNTAVWMFRDTFSGCRGITSIPTDLFKYNVNVGYFGGVFAYCDGITDPIPETLFSTNVLAIEFSSAFRSCKGLTCEIPTDLFRYNAEALYFDYTFASCENLTGTLPETLFSSNPKATTFSGLFSAFGYMDLGCYKLTGTIPADFFRYNPLVTNVSYTFETCSGLTGEIPSGLFAYNPLITDFSGTFAYCAGTTSIGTDLFINQVNALYFEQTFMYCYGLTTVPTDLFRYNTQAVDFDQIFHICNHLSSVPQYLFRYNLATSSFSNAFYSCTKLQLNKYIFYAEGEQGTRFASLGCNFESCFERTTFTGVQGTAPDLWNCDYGTGWTYYPNCFSGAGNSLTSLTNYIEIPEDWGGGTGYTRFTMRTTAANQVVELPTNEHHADLSTNATHNFTAYWGDGTSSSITAWNDTDKSHTYVTPGYYTLCLSGTCTSYAYRSWNQGYNAGTELDLIKILDVTDMGFTQFNFNGCANLIYTSSTLGRLTHLTTAEHMFYDCTHLRSITPGIFDGGALITSFEDLFWGCSALSGSIPEELFKYNTLVTTFYGAFGGFTNISGEIPANLFAYNTVASNFFEVFYQCNLTGSIPEDLFLHNPITNVGWAFACCYYLTGSIPANLLLNKTLLTNAEFLFYSCGSLTGPIPETLFSTNTALDDVGALFCYDSGLTGSIPENLFANNPLITSLALVFSGCSGLTGPIPADLFKYQTLALSAYETFYDCGGLTGEIPDTLFSHCTNMEDFSKTFEGCSNLTLVPAGLFRSNTVAYSFYRTFFACRNIQVSPYVFYNEGEQATRFTSVPAYNYSFRECFYRASIFTGTQGTAPDLWNCTFGGGAWTSYLCFGGAGNSLSSFSNYAIIPYAWGGPLVPAGTISNADLLNEDMSNITDWTQEIYGAGTCTQVTYDSKSCMKCYSPTSASVGGASIDCGTFGTRTTLSTSMWSHVNQFSTGDSFKINIYNGTKCASIDFAYDGLRVRDSSTYVEIGNDLFVSEIWTEWTFDVSWTTMRMNIYRDKVLMASNIDCDYSSASRPNGTIIVGQSGFNFPEYTYIDWIKVGTTLV